MISPPSSSSRGREGGGRGSASENFRNRILAWRPPCGTRSCGFRLAFPPRPRLLPGGSRRDPNGTDPIARRRRDGMEWDGTGRDGRRFSDRPTDRLHRSTKPEQDGCEARACKWREGTRGRKFDVILRVCLVFSVSKYANKYKEIWID